MREILSASASLDVTPEAAGGRFHVAGRVRARIGQTCVVTLDPIENDIDEAIDLIFAPPEQIPELADLVDEAAESDGEIPDPPEPIENGVIDLGRLATDALFLAIDPYPRKPDAVFEPPVEAADPEDHPFAALKALKLDAKTAGAEEAEKALNGAPARGARPFAFARPRDPGFGSEIRSNRLNYLDLFACTDSASRRLGHQKRAVKRLCRDGDTLLSRPGRGAALRFADRRYPRRFPVRGRSASSPQEIRFPGRSCLKRFESRLTPWVAMSAHRSSFPAPRFR